MINCELNIEHSYFFIFPMTTPAKIVEHGLPTVALVGRVNVGKSTLFNRIIEQSLALVSAIPGTTRTRNIATAIWRGKNFRVIDTGGLTFADDVPLEEDIIAQTEIAIKEAEVIIFVTDIREGILPQEKELSRRLFKKIKDKPILLVANKADRPALFPLVHDKEWLQLGLGEPIPVSAANGVNIGDLLDVVYKQLDKSKRRPKQLVEIEPIKISIVGKPNVGKSSLFNKLIGEERVIVSDIPHTTREPHDTLVEVEFDETRPPLSPLITKEGTPQAAVSFPSPYEGEGRVRSKKQHILFIDTAGIRRKIKVSGELERLGIHKSIEAIKRSDVVLFVLDASEPITDQDKQLGGLLREQTKSVIIVINKWDTAEDTSDAFRNEVKKLIYGAFPHLNFAPTILVSAKSGYRVHNIFPVIKQAWEARHTEISDDALHNFLRRVTRKHLPTRGKGVRHPKLLGMTQLRTNPPMFDIRIKAKTSLHSSYLNFIENRLREEFGFFATPVVMKLSKMKR